MPANYVHDALNLYISEQTFTFEPLYSNPNVQRQTLVIARSSGVIQLNAPPAPTLRQEEVITVHGCIGIISLNAGDHLIVATDRARVGRIKGQDIFKLTGHKIIPFATSRLHLSESQVSDDQTYLRLVGGLLDTGYFLFSYGYNLTHSLQRQASLPKDQPMWKTKKLIEVTETRGDNNLSSFILPIMCGFADFRQTTANDKPLTLGLISRRSKFRAGTRFNMRGVDNDGNVANFVETEQLFVAESGHIASYVQTRGSMPMFWQQIVNVKYLPKLVIEANPMTAEAFKRHFLSDVKIYGPVIAVNLINKKGYEVKLGDEFARNVRVLNDPRIRYIHFDFHHECRKMRWDRISLLVDQMNSDLEKQGYCMVNEQMLLLREQTSVVRTNCMDCLDRTNVVQSVLARRMLEEQLRSLEYLDDDQTMAMNEHLEKTFKTMWADNADAVSMQYSGTGALKTDFTRTGKRTTEGIVNDFLNSAMRYLKNNYYDGSRQVSLSIGSWPKFINLAVKDSFDILLGKYVVKPTAKSPFFQTRPLRAILLPIAVLFCLFMTLVTFVMPLELTTFHYIQILFWIGGAAAACQLIILFGRDFVDRPRLVGGAWESSKLK
ncbi:Phosphoinositide phosphatase sac1 [Irineochytrium annulatum]|nr:Phosphoinositide phosphatase sac1 [Irineochytrium annulatum]